MKEFKIPFFKKEWLPYFFIIIFSLCSSLAMFLVGDDYLWYYSVEDSNLKTWQNANGRLFSNQVTILLVRNLAFRIVFVTLTLTLLLIVLGKLFDFANVTKKIKYFIGLTFLIFIPHVTYGETVNWISGFTNYVFSMLIVFIYILFIFRCLFNEHQPKFYTAIVIFFLSILGGMCVEHVTIYNAFLSIAMIIFSVKKNKKCIPHTIAFFVGTLISCFMMFGSGVYSDIYSNGDKIGNRYFEIGFSNILQNAYSYIVVNYTKSYWFMSIMLTLSFTLLYVKKNFSDNKPKYLTVCMAICWLYAIYSFFTMCVSNLRVFTPEMRISALETSFTFIYIVSIAYLINVFLEKDSRIRSYIYLISTALLTGPFLFISPASARCFLANYLFWIILCGEVLSTALKMIDVKYRIKLKGIALAFSFGSAFLIMNACLTNKYINELRFDYIKEQLAEPNNRKIDLLQIPYTEFNNDDLKNGLINSSYGIADFSYTNYILRYYGIEPDPETEYVEMSVSAYNYYINKIEY